jgi:hypothetical protein
MDKKDLMATILDVYETSLKAQLRAVRRLRGDEAPPPRSRKGMSQTNIAYDILLKAGRPLHVGQIIEQAQASHGVRLDRESLVSALSKRVARGDRFVRTEPNTFAARKEARR